MNSSEHVDQLPAPLGKEVKLAEYLDFVKLKTLDTASACKPILPVTHQPVFKQPQLR